MDKPTVIVTGATGGVGAAVCHELADSYSIVAVGRNMTKLAELSDGIDVRQACGDLTDRAFLENLSQSVPHCSAIIHSAGLSRRKSHENITPDDLNEIFSVNFFAVQQLTALFIERIRRAKGDLVFLNSGAGQFSSPGNSLYSASKHALKAYSNSLREEERPNGVRVISIFPGYIRTDMALKISQKAKRTDEFDSMLSAATIASAISAALNAPREAMFEELTIRPTLPITIR